MLFKGIDSLQTQKATSKGQLTNPEEKLKRQTNDSAVFRHQPICSSIVPDRLFYRTYIQGYSTDHVVMKFL